MCKQYNSVPDFICVTVSRWAVSQDRHNTASHAPDESGCLPWSFHCRNNFKYKMLAERRSAWDMAMDAKVIKICTTPHMRMRSTSQVANFKQSEFFLSSVQGVEALNCLIKGIPTQRYIRNEKVRIDRFKKRILCDGEERLLAYAKAVDRDRPAAHGDVQLL